MLLNQTSETSYPPWECDYLPSPRGRLFRAYALHRDSASRDGLVICNALGEEAKSSFAVLNRLSRDLWRRGWSVCRFDYAGTGDSEGEFSDTLPENWIGDALSAVADFRRASSPRSLVLMGLRLGANVAARATDRLREKRGVAALALWEPILDVAKYIRHLTWTNRDPKQRGDMDCFGWRLTGLCLEEIQRRLSLETSHLGGRAFVANISSQTGLSRDFGRLCPLPHAESLVVHVRSRPFWELIGESSCDPLIAETIEWLSHLDALHGGIEP
jgi:pimeloyl-ACP methyl ester carboxylesterase